jgi:predicted DNA-binding transcriptional regulator YafY
MDRTERFYRIRRLLASRAVVPIDVFLADLEVSRATFTRDVEYLRDRLNVPIVWDRAGRGYRLAPGDGTELPGLWLDPDEIRALLAMAEMLDSLQTGLLAEHLAPLRSRLSAFATSHGLSVEAIQRRVRLVASLPRATDMQSMQTVLHAVLERRRLRVDHFHRLRNEATRRELSPQTLVFYRNAWYLQAWCHLREDVRVFSLDAMRVLEITDTAAVEVDPETLRTRLDGSYGIFDGPTVQWAHIRFSPQQARWVAAERWHPLQRGAMREDGSYDLEIPYSDDRELLMDVMRFGVEAEILGPPSLRARIRELHAEAAGRYGGG